MHLQQRLRSLSTELVTLRNRLHVQGAPAAPPKTQSSGGPVAPAPQPVVPPRNNTTSAPPAPVVPVVVAAVEQPLLRPQPPPSASSGGGGVDLEDLIHLQGPLTEDAVMKCLQARFSAASFYVSGVRFFYGGTGVTLRRSERHLLSCALASGRPCFNKYARGRELGRGDDRFERIYIFERGFSVV